MWAIVALAMVFCASAHAQDGAELFHKMQEALGGADRIARVRDFEQIVRADTWDNDGKPHGLVRKRTQWVRPNILRLDQVGPDDTYVLYFNGVSGWEILPDKTVADLAGGELKFAQNYLRYFDLNLWLADRDSQTAIESPAPNVLDISDKDDLSRKIEITLDPLTSLPVKQTSISLADPDHPAASETRFEQWEAVGGVKFPQRISIFHNRKRLAAITVEQTMVNRGIKPEDLAIKPQDLKPDMALDRR